MTGRAVSAVVYRGAEVNCFHFDEEKNVLRVRSWMSFETFSGGAVVFRELAGQHQGEQGTCNDCLLTNPSILYNEAE